MRVLTSEELELVFGGRDGDTHGSDTRGGMDGRGGPTNGEKAMRDYANGDKFGAAMHSFDQARNGDYNQGPPSQDRQHSGGIGSDHGASNSGKSNDRVICTHFYRKGMLDRDLWRADLEYTDRHIPAQTIRGYHAWAIPYVRLMRKSPMAEKLMYPIAYHRARELAFQMGKTSKPSYRGKLIRLIFEPACFAIGFFAGKQDCDALWLERDGFSAKR